ncbi:MAG: ATPase [Candidatus Kerfeldbacteria bacterium CG15_BIG_FIL_POST_REV_8_21_14_020_45_12]|uniref:ATPase n=1 Tax=Candidatus Kerfeldbacteria bacterium CG15_BIG_FIL_POST_REV_8_21_14_020_45_12 TaxID=2014247 RepID=A0A2M7H3U3_9BACT|nr:MAG: ATPase [Candidatus Kerfeldbacteria bacterium CG15_BIG_FIL_POST_REV_8_21_14_020_45_12]PJA94013.1 MAG: ATPase [Candidatus Kerfeldbacteria bacterium CG_4_9_14_3_um_filter_45_8]
MSDSMKTFYDLSAEEALKLFNCTEVGLDEEVIEQRLIKYGRNVLPEPASTPWFVLLFNQVKSFLIILLIVAAIVSYILGDTADAMIIIVAVVINMVVGFIQEWKAEKSVEALRRVIAQQAKVRRGGKEALIPVEQLVPGDILLLDAGDKVPADARLLKLNDFTTNEAPLTGESNEVVKSLEKIDASAVIGDRVNMVFLGTTVLQGSAEAVVTHTGVNTEIGKIAALLDKADSGETPLQKKLDRFARGVGIAVILICVALFIVGVLVGMDPLEIFTISVAVAVSAIPEGLVVAVTVILALGMQRILKRNALVRNLQAAETLGSTSVICTDKTGTITEGKMEVVSVVTAKQEFQDLHHVRRNDPTELSELIFAVQLGMLCNDAHVTENDSGLKDSIIVGNLTEQALLRAGMAVGIDHVILKSEEPRISTIPFNSKNKFMATLHKHPELGKRIYMKGAPEKIVAMSTQVRSGEQAIAFDDEMKSKFENEFEKCSRKGLRILGLAYKNVLESTEEIAEQDCTDMIFAGFVGIKDPLRPNIAETFAKTKAAGIRTVMITGDHKLTAQAIAAEVGLLVEDKNILTGDELHAMTQEELNSRVEDITVYARVSPEDKLNIINAWKSRGKVVAMTGDGVNDSPALKTASIGVALGSGTDVAKEAADIVLLDDRFETIVAAVEEGRGIFDNIRKVVLFLMSDSFSEVVVISFAIMLGLPVPLTAAQILWINLVSDGFPSVALTVDPKDEGIMDEPPRSLRESVLNNEMKILIFIISVVTGILNILVFWYYLKTTNNLELSRSVVFLSLSIDSLIYVFSIRQLRRPLFSRGIFKNRWLLLGVAASFFIQLSAFYVPPLSRLMKTVPLGLRDWGVAITIATLVIMVTEIIKYIFNRRHRRTNYKNRSALA